MSERNAGGEPTEGSAQRGLWRLMLKLPALRGELQIRVARSDALKSLCEAYDYAASELQILRTRAGEHNTFRAREYETICSEIEADVIDYCVNDIAFRK